jgi:hypothetical protein
VEGYSQELARKKVVTIVNGKPAHIRFVWPEDVSEALNY